MSSVLAKEIAEREWFVVESGGDGAQAVVVCGMDAVRAELKRQMWDDDSDPSDDVKADIALIDDPDYWTSHYPEDKPFTWKLDFEDGYVRVQRLTSAAALIDSALPNADADLKDAAMLLRIFIYKANKTQDASMKCYAAKATDWLKKRNLEGSILRAFDKPLPAAPSTDEKEGR